VNGCYSAPKLDYTVVRGGKIWNGSGRKSFWCPAVYSFHNGKLLSAWESDGTPGISGGQIDQLVADGLVTDTFCFGPPGLSSGKLSGTNGGARAQRTFIGTNGKAGDIWICVSDGRYNDGESAGLTFYEGMEFLKEKGCTFGVHLDGGGSSTMVYRGHVLNAAKGGERAVVDFVYFK
jgi:exopolysaccharide biosynthesis protein